MIALSVVDIAVGSEELDVVVEETGPVETGPTILAANV
jgi:hypothetical protein